MKVREVAMETEFSSAGSWRCDERCLVTILFFELGGDVGVIPPQCLRFLGETYISSGSANPATNILSI
jgi:hypothetical protein